MALKEEMETEPELVYELIISIINSLSIFANLLLVVTVLRSRSMRTKMNLYILNVAVADFLTLVVLLLYYLDKRILHFTQLRNDYAHLQCILTNLEISLQILTLVFVIVLVTNTLFNSKCLSQTVVLVVTWNVAIVCFYLNTQYCRGELTVIQGAIYVSFLIILVLILCTKCYLRCKIRGDLSREGAFRVNFATIFACLCLTSWLVNIVAEFCFRTDSIVKHFVLAFGTSVKVGKNIALAFYLFRYNEMFKESLMALFNCGSIRINDSVHYSTDHTSIDLSSRNEKILT